MSERGQPVSFIVVEDLRVPGRHILVGTRSGAQLMASFVTNRPKAEAAILARFAELDFAAGLL